METSIEKISRTTGMKQTSCACPKCQNMCRRSPCLPTPEDVQKLIAAGYRDRLRPTLWAAGLMMGLTPRVLPLIGPWFDPSKGACTFFEQGRCILHDRGLKPTEGKLASCQPKTVRTREEHPTYAVAMEWDGYTEADIERILTDPE